MTVKQMPLEAVAVIYSGTNRKGRQEALGEDGYPWVKVEDLNNGELETASHRLSPGEAKAVRLSPAGTVFCSGTGTIGKVGIAKAPMVPSNNMFALEFDRALVDPAYGMYCLLAMREELKAEAGGAVYASLRLSVFRKFRIPVPPLEVQRGIAGKLAALDKSRMEQTAQIERVKQAAHVLFDRCFGEEVEAVAQKRYSLKLCDCADILLNGAAKKEEGMPVRYLSTAGLCDWEIDETAIPQEKAQAQKTDRYFLNAGDIVMNRINSAQRLGRCGLILTKPKEPTVFGQNTLRLRAYGDRQNPLFLFAWLTHPFVKQYIREHAKNSTSFQSSLNRQTIETIPVPAADLARQEAYAGKLRHYFDYIRTAEEIIETLEQLQNVWYGRIRFLSQQSGQEERSDGFGGYAEGRYWTSPTGVVCFFDPFLECIQVPPGESRMVRPAKLPPGVEVQFLDEVRLADRKDYGCLGHTRLKRIDGNTLQVIVMEPAAYQTGEGQQAEETRRQIEENGILSEQQDFGYIRRIREIVFAENETVQQCLIKYSPDEAKGYCRFDRLAGGARRFVLRLSAFQQAVFEEFLLAMQPLACHMVGKQVALRAGKERFEAYGIQDVIATVRLLEHAGLLEKRQGLYLNYDEDYGQGEARRLILDHRGAPIPVDTWICGDVREQETEDAADKGLDRRI